MVRIELYVVLTELEKTPLLMTHDKLNMEELKEIKAQLCKEFGGLTIIPNCSGLWYDNGHIEIDKVEIWRILSATAIDERDIRSISERLKVICTQNSQLFTIDETPYFV